MNQIGLIKSWASSVSIIKSKFSLYDNVAQIATFDKNVRWFVPFDILDKDIWTAFTFLHDGRVLHYWAENNVPPNEILIKQAFVNDPLYWGKIDKWASENKILINPRMFHKWVFATECIDNELLINKDKVREWTAKNPIDKVSKFDYKFSRFQYKFSFWFNSQFKLDADPNFSNWVHETLSQLETMEFIKEAIIFQYYIKAKEGVIGVLLEDYGKMCDLDLLSIVEFNSYIRPVFLGIR